MLGYTSFIVLAVVLIASTSSLEFEYHNHTVLEEYLTEVNENYTDLTHLYSIGKSIQGRDLWVLAIGKNVHSHVDLRPEVKYIGNMHGDEVTGREILIHFIDQLVTQYGSDPEITEFLNQTRIHILVTMNPDGFETSLLQYKENGTTCNNIDGGRRNANGTDLNRNFPDFFEPNNGQREPETLAIMDWLTQYPFILSANLHDGAVLANYPYDNFINGNFDRFSISTDEDVFRDLSLTYAKNHAYMWNGTFTEECNGEYFEDGVTNGADWYTAEGSMQDYNYNFGGCMEITMELDCCKFSPEEKLEEHWIENRDSLLAYIKKVHMGIKGLVTSTSGQRIPNAEIRIQDRDKVAITTQWGEYWKILRPGFYHYEVSAEGYVSQSDTIHISPQEPLHNLNFTLEEETWGSEEQFIYHTHEQLEEFLSKIAPEFPDLTSVYKIGESTQGRPLNVMRITSNVNENTILKPYVKYIGNIHGNEVTGRESLFHFISYLLNSYASNQTIQHLINNTDIHILIAMNPDGYQVAYDTFNLTIGECTGVVGRGNANGVDLNRNFPDMLYDNPQPTEVETQVIMDWIDKYPFVLSATLHDGALLANYVYDNYEGAYLNPASRYSLSTDDDVARHVSKVYSFNHATMHQGIECDSGDGFEDGIVNGALWYPVQGGLQDYHYNFKSIMEVTLELSCCKFPPEGELKMKFIENREAMVGYLQQVHIGIKGLVQDEDGSPVTGARISVADRDKDSISTNRGEYWRLLMPGVYRVQVSAPGYETQTDYVEVFSGQVTRKDFKLAKGVTSGGSRVNSPFSFLLHVLS